MKIAFLDFDGVLNTPKTWGLRPFHRAVDDDKVQRLGEFCQHHNVSVVISSTWRNTVGLPMIREILRAKGFPVERIIGQTPWLPSQPRLSEIELWLSQHTDSIGAPRESYVILDDTWPHPTGTIAPWRWVPIDYNEGLTSKSLDMAAAILGIPYAQLGPRP